jgi:hypothetical protein
MADLATQVLIEIRDEIRSTKHELSSRLDQSNTRLDRLERRQVQGELRLVTDIATLTGVMRDLRDKLIEDHSLRDVVLDHEQRLVSLEVSRDKIGG